MVIGFFRSKSNKLKKLLEEDMINDAQKMLDEDDSLTSDLFKYLKMNSETLKANAIYLLTKNYLKNNKDISELYSPLKVFLSQKSEVLVLNSLMSLKLITDVSPEVYENFSSEVTQINKTFVNLDIRNYTGNLIKKYGKFKEYNLSDNQKMLQKHVKQLMKSSKQESLFGRLMEIGSSLFVLMPEKLEVTEKMLEDSITKDDLQFNVFTIETLKSGKIKEMDPLNIVYQLSKLPTLTKGQVDDTMDQTLDLMGCSKNMIVRNMVLNTVYEVSKKYPDVLYNHISGLERYEKQYGGNDPVFKAIVKELSKKYNLENSSLSKVL
ncbi:hypothetical protein HNP87_000853 [Methanococcus maripaludis]|uniref:Uncharacterized protein n=1 Tax=Methanococcus maripaludis TaxID=39152 RepID=A0A7J9NIG5_METMI|nr:hypothetical protein [Methanococcus maripaludis]MBA2840341.1 hypothetical protein [Methanococcus maripaludis]MBA2860053.1 hypothetical protein [Methanococcus maripaludis]MBA2868695.1 hypothetical protein [Methanococcus maripaludis]MBB6402616.1 hypothetical protein [Methanococcus maripaludis]